MKSEAVLQDAGGIAVPRLSRQTLSADLRKLTVIPGKTHCWSYDVFTKPRILSRRVAIRATVVMIGKVKKNRLCAVLVIDPSRVLWTQHP